MPVPDPPTLHDLSDDDIVSNELVPPASPLATTGIVFHGLEHSEPIAIRERKGRHEPEALPAAEEKS
jgi:hypothetical protein